jgi:hypothetical protein
LTEISFAFSFFSPEKPPRLRGQEKSVFSSVHDVHAGLGSAGYITDEITATIVYLAARLHKPILLEGPAGSGKTELAYAVAKATSTEVERLQCFEGINEEKAIGRFDEALQRLAVELRSKSGPVEWEQLKQELHGLKFFSADPLLRALQYSQRRVLLIDELDKVSQAFETLSFRYIGVVQEEYAVSPDGMKMFGVLDLETQPRQIHSSGTHRRLARLRLLQYGIQRRPHLLAAIGQVPAAGGIIQKIVAIVAQQQIGFGDRGVDLPVGRPLIAKEM